MPQLYPEEFRRRAVELARLRKEPVSQIAAELVASRRRHSLRLAPSPPPLCSAIRPGSELLARAHLG